MYVRIATSFIKHLYYRILSGNHEFTIVHYFCISFTESGDMQYIGKNKIAQRSWKQSGTQLYKCMHKCSYIGMYSSAEVTTRAATLTYINLKM